MSLLLSPPVWIPKMEGDMSLRPNCLQSLSTNYSLWTHGIYSVLWPVGFYCCAFCLNYTINLNWPTSRWAKLRVSDGWDNIAVFYRCQTNPYYHSGTCCDMPGIYSVEAWNLKPSTKSIDENSVVFYQLRHRSLKSTYDNETLSGNSPKSFIFISACNNTKRDLQHTLANVW